MTSAEQVELLERGAIEVVGRVRGSSNQALLVELTLGSASALACYKSERGERPLWDFPDGLWRREVAAYELDVVLRTDLVPPTVARPDAPFGPGSLQWWVEDNGEDHYFTLRERRELHAWFARLGAFDVVANNADRKSGHVLFDGRRCWAIDNGLCFHVEDKLRTVIWEFAHEPIAPEVLERLAALADGEVGRLGDWLAPDELALTQLRAAELVRHGVLPPPDEDRDWPPYPWPLI
jgi:uncharacterized repeat protein (TIGR03843 family)